MGADGLCVWWCLVQLKLISSNLLYSESVGARYQQVLQSGNPFDKGLWHNWLAFLRRTEGREQAAAAAAREDEKGEGPTRGARMAAAVLGLLTMLGRSRKQRV